MTDVVIIPGKIADKDDADAIVACVGDSSANCYGNIATKQQLDGVHWHSMGGQEVETLVEALLAGVPAPGSDHWNKRIERGHPRPSTVRRHAPAAQGGVGDALRAQRVGLLGQGAPVRYTCTESRPGCSWTRSQRTSSNIGRTRSGLLRGRADYRHRHCHGRGFSRTTCARHFIGLAHLARNPAVAGCTHSRTTRGHPLSALAAVTIVQR